MINIKNAKTLYQAPPHEPYMEPTIMIDGEPLNSVQYFLPQKCDQYRGFPQ